MALISTLRKRMGKIVVGFVAFSMFAFILTDFLNSNSTLIGGNDRDLAEIAGNTISYESFNERVNQLAATFAVNYGRNPSSDDLTNIRKEAWNALIIENAYQKELDKLGIKVTDAEMVDMVQGNNISPQIKQFFTDPNTGEFSRDVVISTLQNLGSADPRQRQSWNTFEASLAPNRAIQKYDNLFEKTNYVTQAEAKSLYSAQNSNMTVDYFYVPFFSVADSLFEVSNSEMESYLSENADNYEREESRNLQYVVFTVEPSAEDTAFVIDEINALKDGLAQAQNDSVYVSINSDSPNPFQSITDPSAIPGALMVDGKIAEEGTVTEPVLGVNNYTVMKLSAITEGDEYFVKARHILIKPAGTTDADKAAAKTKAQGILNRLKRGADFTALAAENSEDRSNANNGGDLGWFGENGNFVQEFKDAAFAKRGTGLLSSPVETSFGYHIIRIDEPKTNTVYKVASIEKELFASDATQNEIYRQADILAAETEDASELKAKAEELGLTVRNASNIGPNDTRVGTITDGRQIVSWAYNKAETGSISDVKEIGDTYVVAGLTSVQEKGTAKLSQVSGEIRTKVLNQKKADYIISKVNELDAEDVAGMKDAYGEGARSGSADLTLSSNSFPNVGFAPEAVGVAFSLEEGEKTAPFKLDNGVILLSATAKSTPEDLDNYDAYLSQVSSSRAPRKAVIANFPLSFYPVMVSQRLDNAIKEYADIEDKRYKFY
ncbi:MAG: SurA N-terminal domain-containing protein [Cyclobacteriaceae bacterium]